MQPGDVRGDVAGGAQRGLAAALLPGERRDHLFYQGDLAVGGRLDRAEVAWLDAVLAHRHRAPDDGQRFGSVCPRVANKAVVLELGEQRLVGDGRLEQLAAGQRGGGRGRSGAAVGLAGP